MADIEKMQAELQRLQEKQAVLKARQERQQARLNAEKRKQRNKRLIEKGAILEDIQAVAQGLEKAPKVPRVSKTEDPQGYEEYQAYKNYNHQKEVLSEKISPADSQEWLETLIDFRNWGLLTHVSDVYLAVAANERNTARIRAVHLDAVFSELFGKSFVCILARRCTYYRIPVIKSVYKLLCPRAHRLCVRYLYERVPHRLGTAQKFAASCRHCVGSVEESEVSVRKRTHK